MIAKRVTRQNAGSFRKLGLYIARAEKAPPLPEPTGGSEWRRTTNYILDIAGGGERTEGVRLTNCAAVETDMAIREIELTQAMNRRATGSRTYHLVVSFPPGERPTPEQLIDIEDELCAAVGLGQHQRISAVHTDTDHLHIHVAINQIHPQTYNCVEPWYDKDKLMRACDLLEAKHGLQRTSHGRRAESGRKADRAAAMEQHGGTQSLHSWIKEEVLPAISEALPAAQSWQDVHALLARYDLTIQPRGAGLVIRTRRGPACIKASAVDRSLSSKALTARFGAFVPPDPIAKLPGKRRSYRRRKVHTGDDINRLWADYRKARQAAIEKRDGALAEIGERARRRRIAIDNWYADRCSAIGEDGGLTRLGKASHFSKLDLELATDLARLDRQRTDERAQARRALAPPSWIGFLRERAASGDAAARSALERQEQKFRSAIEAHLDRREAADADVQERILQELKPEARPDGQMAYRFRDGGAVVTDEAGGVAFERMSPFALIFDLHLHIANHSSGPMTLVGGVDLQRLVAMATVAHGMAISFADAELEQERGRLRAAADRDPNFAAALAYLVEHQASVATRDGYFPGRVWEPALAGPATLERFITLRNGAPAAVLRRDAMVMIKPCGADEARAQGTFRGKPVHIGADGQIADLADVAVTAPPSMKRRWFRW